MNSRPLNVVRSSTSATPRIKIERDATVDDISEFHQPLWWNSEYVHLAFLSINPPESGVFEFLFSAAPHIDRNRLLGFILDPRQLLDWNLLQHNMRTVIKELANKSNLVPFPSIIDNALSCTGFHQNKRELIAVIYRNKGWFLYWIAQLSFVIAASLTLDNDNLDCDLVYADKDHTIGKITLPKWYEYLASRNWHQGYLSSIHAAAAMFHPDVSRVGIFLNVVNPGRSQYSVDWFLKFHVPVWYPWGTAEVNAATETKSLARLAPPVDQMQMAMTFLSTPVTLSSRTTDDGGDMMYWKEWLAKRKAREAKILAAMSSSDRRSMIDRERQPPKKKCRVYVWRTGDDGALKREAVTSRENEDTLADFGRKQKVYSAVFNEWDCWDDMGQKDEDEIAREEWDDVPEDRILPPNAVLSMPLFNTSNAEFEPMDLDRPNTERLGTITLQHPPSYANTYQIDLHQFEALVLLREYYGFVAPLPLNPVTGATPVNEKTQSIFCSILGLRTRDEEFFESDIAHHAIKFLESFTIAPCHPANDVWDLGTGNRLAVQGTERFRRMRRLVNTSDNTCVGYLFEFAQNQTTAPWKILVKDAVNALLVCRLDPDLNDYTVAFMLLQRGIRFSTVCSFSKAAHSRPPPTIPTLPLPVRLMGYEFGRDDYTLYVQTRNKLLQNPRVARAALLQGGITWRLAVEHVSFSTTLLGPTASVVSGCKYANDKEELYLGDDILTNREMELICGAVVCMTGMYYFSCV